MNLKTIGFGHTYLHPYRRAGIILLLSFIFTESAAQFVQPVDTTASPTYKYYMSIIGSGSNLYNGTEYTAFYPSTIGTQFWDTVGFRNGLISYEGVVYRGVPMAYDLVSNEVIIRDQRQIVIKLDPAKIDFFQVGGHRFVSFKGDELSQNTLPVDVYDLVHDGKMKVYVKRKKQVSRNYNSEGRYPFMSFNAYFVYKDSMYHSIAGKNDLLKLFHDESEKIKTMWKEEKLNYRTDPERMITLTVRFYSYLKDEL